MTRLFLILLVFCAFCPVLWARGEASSPEKILSSLLSPEKIDGLQGERAANPRLRKIMFWVETARLAGKDSAVVIVAAQKLAGYAGTPRADADKESLLRNLAILERLGCLDEAGMAALRTGGAPNIKKGPYMGDTVAVDHIIPIAVVPELENRLFNLEFMPTRLNQEKGAKVGVRQRQLAEKWLKLGLLSRQGYEKVHGSS